MGEIARDVSLLDVASSVAALLAYRVAQRRIAIYSDNLNPSELISITPSAPLKMEDACVVTTGSSKKARQPVRWATVG